MPDPLTRAQPPLEFIPPNLNLCVLRTVQTLLPAWLKFRTSLTEIQAERVEILAKLYHQFQSGNGRFLLAFRHPNPEDSFSLAYLLWQCVPQVARQQGIPLKHPVHAHFIYDRGIPLWAGSTVGWLYSKLGGTPIQRGKVDRLGLKSVRDLFANATFPIAAAPEGANNGHNEVVSPLEPGIPQFGFWCVEDLRKADRAEPVYIVPLGIQYHYVNPPWQAIKTLLSQLEADSGIADTQPQPTLTPMAAMAAARLADEQAIAGLPADELTGLYQRLFRLGEHLLTLMEKFYAEYYHRPIPPATESTDTTLQDPHSVLSQRLQTLLAHALDVAEQYFGLSPKGSFIDRCRRLEQAGWDWIYRTDLKQPEQLSPVERGLADRVAEEASLRMWHMRIVETFVAVTGRYVLEKPSADRFAETLLLLRDMIMRLKGENPFPRPALGKQRVQMTVGNPLCVSDRWEDYRANRRQAIATLTQDLQAALEDMIVG